MMGLGYGAAVIILMSIALATCQELPKDTEDKIDAFLTSMMSCRQVPGLALSVVVANKPVVAKGYGATDFKRNIAVTNQTLFTIASVTKSFVATVAAKVLELNPKYDWDTPVRSILGKDFHLCDAFRTQQVSLRDLLAHKVNLPRHDIMRLMNISKEEYIKRFRFVNSTTGFRQRYRYNNLMYQLAAFTMEKITGRSWDDLVSEYIYRPLGMTSSTFTSRSRDQDPSFALPHLINRETKRMEAVSMDIHKAFYGMNSAPGGVVTNSADMAKYLAFHLSRGRDQDGRRVVSWRQLSMISRPQFYTTATNNYEKPEDPATFATHLSGLGLRVAYYRGLRVIWHSGNLLGFYTRLTMVPSKNLGIFTSVNGGHPDVMPIRTMEMAHLHLLDLLMGETPWLTNETICKLPFPLPADASWELPNENINDDVKSDERAQQLPLTTYAGEYGNFAYGNITISVNSSQNVLELHYGVIGHWYLIPTASKHQFNMTGTGVFYYRPANPGPVVFSSSIESNDVIDTVVIPFESPDVTFLRGLKLADAPPPPCYKGECDCRPSGESKKGVSLSLFFLILTFLLT